MPAVRSALRPGMPEAPSGGELHPEDEPFHPGELLGGEPPADVPLGGLPERPAPPRAGDRPRLGQRQPPAEEAGEEAGHGPAADVPGGDRARRYRRGGGAQAEGAQVHPGVAVPVLRRPVER